MAKTILLADDSVTIRKVVELTFMDEDYEVVAVASGDEALAQLDAVAPDVIIADIHMPGADGYEVTRVSKSKRPEVPVLLLVGTFEQFDADDVAACGAERFLKKPFDSQELLRMVDDLLEAAPAPEPELVAPDSGVESSFSFDDAAPSTQVEPPTEDEIPSPFGEPSVDMIEPAVEVMDTPFAEPSIEEPVAELEPAPAIEEEPALELASSEEVTEEVPAPVIDDEPEATPHVADVADVAEEAAAAFEPEEAVGLSEEDVDRIARKVVDYLTDDVVRDLAWEVLPDLAEVIIKARLRELEGQIE